MAGRYAAAMAGVTIIFSRWLLSDVPGIKQRKFYNLSLALTLLNAGSLAFTKLVFTRCRLTPS